MKQVILVGFMGAGKTTVGQLLADKQHLPYYDIDEVIARDQQKSIPEIFDAYGESFFRELETAKLADLLTKEGIISTGGGIILNEKNRQLLRASSSVYYLQTSPETFLERLKNDTSRPLIQQKSQSEVAAIFRPRVPLYKAVSSFIVNTDHKTPEAIAAEIIEKNDSLKC